MHSTIHILIDELADDAELLQSGLDELLNDGRDVVFRYHGASSADQPLIEEARNTLRTKKLRKSKLDEIEQSRVCNAMYSRQSKKLMEEIKPDFRRRIKSGPPPPEPYLSWQDIFQLVRSYRPKWDITNEEFAVLLTPRGNEENWFAAFRAHPTPDAFVHTSDWEYFTNTPVWYPVAYEVWEQYLQYRGFGSLANTLKYIHQRPKGCINDLCKNKKDIHLKIRTADICQDCLEVMLKNGIPDSLLIAASHAFETIRRQSQFLQRHIHAEEPSDLHVDKKGRLRFPGFQDITISLSPIEKTLYLFFLKHPEGVRRVDLSDFKNELLELYQTFRKQDVRTALEVVNNLVSPWENSSNEKISRIKKKLEKHLQLPERAVHYSIQKVDEAYLISLPPNKVNLHETWQ